MTDDMTDEEANLYAAKYVKMLKDCKTDKEMETIVDKIYEDGLSDGYTESEDENKELDADSAREGMAAQQEFEREGMD